MARNTSADEFVYDECGGFGDGVSVFVDDNIKGLTVDSDGERIEMLDIKVVPFNAGDPVLADKDEEIDGTSKTAKEIYANQKAHAHGVVAQMLYNTYRFIMLDERDIDPEAMLSIDIEDDDVWNKILREMSTALWVKSEANSKKKVESKKDMKKRTGQESPNLNDAIIMCYAPNDLAFSDYGSIL